MNFLAHPCTLRQLQYAVAVAESLSFRRAAEACRVSQPALSAQIAELEGTLGVTLFERDRRRVMVTAAGAEVLLRARRVLVEADDLVSSARRAGDPFSGALRVGVIPTISPYLLPALVPAIRGEHPKLAIQWLEERTRVLVDRLDAGSLDAAVLALEADLGALEHAVLLRDPFVLAAPVGHRLAKGRGPVKLDDLRGAEMLLLDEGHCLRDQALSFCADADVREAGFRATSLSTLAQMVAGGAGVTLLPQIAVATEARRGDLRIRRIAAPTPKRTLVLAWRRRSPLAGALQTLAATCRSAAEHAARAGTQP